MEGAYSTEIEERTKIHENINKTILETQNQLNNLTKMRIRDLINLSIKQTSYLFTDPKEYRKKSR